MTNLKDKILHALHNNKRLGTILDEVSNSQENLLKNHSNPVFNDKDKKQNFTKAFKFTSPWKIFISLLIHFMKTIWLK